MKRSTFLIIIAVLNGLMGLLLMFGTSAASVQFGMAENDQTIALLRNLGTILFSLGVLDFMVRNESDSYPMMAILLFNLIGPGLGIVTALLDVASGAIEFAKVGPSLIVPLIGTSGSLVYLTKMKPTE